MQEDARKIDIPEAVLQDVQEVSTNIFERQLSGSLPYYPQFVDKLFAPMDTLADTFHHAGSGIAGEGGEILDITKKAWAYKKPIDAAVLEHLLEELGDMRFYYQAMLNMLGLSDEDIQSQNMRKLIIRYPGIKYSHDSAIARADKEPGADRKFFGSGDVCKGPELPPSQA